MALLISVFRLDGNQALDLSKDGMRRRRGVCRGEGFYWSKIKSRYRQAQTPDFHRTTSFAGNQFQSMTFGSDSHFHLIVRLDVPWRSRIAIHSHDRDAMDADGGSVTFDFSAQLVFAIIVDLAHRGTRGSDDPAFRRLRVKHDEYVPDRLPLHGHPAGNRCHADIPTAAPATNQQGTRDGTPRLPTRYEYSLPIHDW